MYAITKNGIGQWTVERFEDVRHEVLLGALNTTTYNQGTMVGELVRIDENGNVWSARRVTPQQANAIESARKVRQANQAARYFASKVW